MDARDATKRETHGTGSKVHLTATCDEESPHLLTTVDTTPAPTTDVERTPIIQTHLAAQGVLPREHRLETGSIDAEHLVTSRLTPAVELVGPVLPDTSWQARSPAGCEVSCLASDWEAETVMGPQGHRRRRWTPTRDHQHGGQELIAIPFDPTHGAVGPVRAHGPQAKTGPRTMKLRPQPPHEALQVARQCQTTAAFQAVHAARAGVEGTLSQGTRAFPWRQTRSIRLAKTHLQHLLMAMAMHLARVAAWLAETPRAPTRLSSFAALAGACG